MPDYGHHLEICRRNSEFSRTVIDEFIIYYAAQRDKLDLEFDNRINSFRHATQEIPPSFTRMLKSQYIAHRVFKQGGLISKYLTHSAIRNLDVEQRNFLVHAASNPWRFSFSEIISNPAPDFYEMEDVFTGDIYLLHSPSVTLTLEEKRPLLWFTLVGFNGSCWQSFGPMISYRAFNIDDIYFFATELNQLISSVEDLLNDVENNPVPYMMLLTGSEFPLIEHGKFETVQLIGESDAIMPDIEVLKKKFRVEYAAGVFKLSHKVWSGPPHYAEVFFDEEKQIIFLHALTDHGYRKIASLLNAYDFAIPVDPDIRLHLPMIHVINKLMKRKLELNPYSRLFEIESSPESKESIDKVNQVLSLALPFINAGIEPNIDEIAKKIGVDSQVAKDLIQHSMERINKLRGKNE